MDSELVSQHSLPYSPGVPYLMYVDCMCDDRSIMVITPWMTKGGLVGLAGGPARLGLNALHVPSQSLFADSQRAPSLRGMELFLDKGKAVVGPVKAMAPHSSTLAWKILWTEEPGRLQSMGSHRVGHD